jgi:hypothetical protein
VQEVLFEHRIPTRPDSKSDVFGLTVLLLHTICNLANLMQLCETMRIERIFSKVVPREFTPW